MSSAGTTVPAADLDDSQLLAPQVDRLRRQSFGSTLSPPLGNLPREERLPVAVKARIRRHRQDLCRPTSAGAA